MSVQATDAIAALLRSGRIRKGWKQSELAEQAGVSRTTLIHLERGTTQDPHAATLSKLAQALDISPAELAAARHVDVVDFDYQSNPAIAEAVEREPQRFRHLTAADWVELSSQFGVGGGLTVDGALAAVDRLQSDKATLHKLKLVLQTHLREPAQQLIDALYQSVEVSTLQQLKGGHRVRSPLPHSDGGEGQGEGAERFEEPPSP